MPKPYQKSKKSSSSSKPSNQHKKSSTTKTISTDQKKKSVATPAEDQIINKNSSQPTDIIRKIWAKQDHLIITPVSSRYLLGDTPYLDGTLSDYDSVLALDPVEDEKNKKKITQSTKDQDESAASKPSSSSSSKSSSSDQVRLQSLFHLERLAF